MKSVSLRRKMLVVFLPVVSLPLALVGAWTGWWTYRNSIAEIKENLLDRVKICAELTNETVERKMTLLESLAIEPMVVAAAREGTQLAQERSWDDRSIAELEPAFARSKLLPINTGLNDRLQDVARLGEFSEIIVTERHGLNIGYTQLTSDFVQRDETWWMASKQQQRWIGEPVFDQSTNTLNVELGGAIVDPVTGEFLGVIKLGYAVENLTFLVEILRNFDLMESEVLQLLEVEAGGTVMATLTEDGGTVGEGLIGAEEVLERAIALVERAEREGRSSQLATDLFVVEGRIYGMAKIPVSDWVAIASIDRTFAVRDALVLAVELMLSCVLLAIVAAIAIWQFSNGLTTPLSRLAQAADSVASGNLNTRVEVSGSAEIELLARSFNATLERIEQVLEEQQRWRDRAVELLKELQQMTVSMQGVADSVQTVRREVNAADSVVAAGDESMTQTVENIGSIEASVSEASSQLQQLQRASDRVSQAVGLVSALAERSNLLALNASVEAARAGEGGREFAIVAKEMRELAQHSAQVTQEIDRTVGEIQRQIHWVNTAIEESRLEASTGKKSVHRTQQELIRITKATDSISQLVREIDRATQSQASTSDYLSQAISRMMRR
ncbi:methyl-accepting chemotaxis protein [Baaleninema sp.]|uniref:methyl-accepting chemotaxis protein n=1 Tax=Baaleninema sp. TaxID=3101197 RepID=UPI003CFD5F94